MYEKFKNDFMMRLYLHCQLSEDQIKDILRQLDNVACDYDIKERETSIIPYQQQLPEAVKIYLVSKKVEGWSDKTLYNRKLALTNFFLAVNKNPEQITTNDCRVFLYRYQEQRKVTNRTIDKYRDTLFSFFKWAKIEKYIPENPMEPIGKIKYSKPERRPLNQVELEYVRKSCITKKERAIVEILYSTGIRVGELVNLKISDIDWNDNSVRVYGTKDREFRTEFLNAKSEVALKEYLASREDNNEYLMVSDRKPHNRMHNCGIQKIIKQIAKRTIQVNKPITPHVFRHTMATQALASGMEITDLQQLLGHDQISSTLIYAHNNIEHVKMEHKRCII